MIKDIRINTKAFEGLGWQPTFNDALFAELIAEQTQDTVVPLDKYVTLKIEPHPSQVVGGGPPRVNSASHQDGDYNEESTTINLFLKPDAARSNRTLSHVTRHWVQDVTNMYPRSRTARGRFIETVKATRYEWHTMGLGLVVAGSLDYTMYESTQNVPAVALSGLAVLGLTAAGALRTANAIHLPWERDAYHFEKDPTVFKKYGKIITHEEIAS
jgi:hypothetical protein